jgi:hypothetical protein
MPIGPTSGFLDFTNATPRANVIVALSNIGIGTDVPLHAFDLRGTANVADMIVNNDLTLTGGLTTNSLTINSMSMSTTSNFQQVTNVGNVTTNTVEFTNPTTGLTVTSNAEVGGELSVSGNATVSGELSVSGDVGMSNNLTVSGNVEVGTANLFVDTETGRVGVGTTTPSKSLDVNGDIAVRGNVTYPMVRWEVDLTSQSTSNFYPIEFTHLDSEGTPDLPDHHPIHFKIFGESLSGGDAYNENTLVGYAKGGGWSDHGPMYNIHLEKHSPLENRFQGLYEGNTVYTNGIVIYMRGGYRYSAITDANEVVTHTSAYTYDDAVFAIKDVNGTDVSGTSANISELVDLGASTVTDQRWVSGIRYSIPKTRAQMLLRNSGDIRYNVQGWNVMTDYYTAWTAYSSNPLFTVSITGDYTDGAGQYVKFRLAVQNQSTLAVSYFPSASGWTKYMYVDNNRLDGHGYHGILSGLTPGTSYKCRLEVNKNNSTSTNYYTWNSLYGVVSGLVWD